MKIICDKCKKSFESWDMFCIYCGTESKRATDYTMGVTGLFLCFAELAKRFDIPFGDFMKDLNHDWIYLYDNPKELDRLKEPLRKYERFKKRGG
jgi:hypothetical protein